MAVLEDPLDAYSAKLPIAVLATPEDKDISADLPTNVLLPAAPFFDPMDIALTNISPLEIIAGIYIKELNVFIPATVCAVVKSTKFLVAEPVPPFATGTTPEIVFAELAGAAHVALPLTS
jgi:hypothetical protein